MRTGTKPLPLGSPAVELVVRRLVNGVEQIAAAPLLGVSAVSLNRYERGHAVPPERVMTAARKCLPI